MRPASAELEVVFGSREGQFLAIVPMRRPYADPGNLSDDSDDRDANWVLCRVEARLRGFRANFDVALQTFEFPPFRDALHRSGRTSGAWRSSRPSSGKS